MIPGKQWRRRRIVGGGGEKRWRWYEVGGVEWHSGRRQLVRGGGDDGWFVAVTVTGGSDNDDDLWKAAADGLNWAHKTLSAILSWENSKKAAVEAQLKKIECTFAVSYDWFKIEAIGILDALIRESHEHAVLSSLETVMSLVLEESEEVNPDLISLLLDCVKKDNQDILAVAKGLA
ncbi:hypothetical protein Syun_019219 [Stephania yunnanensis]|uniref:Uncharacterized protein n=1 Tax=Stephania yunnanensis TaxID=152371 RepID=A0AAP0ITP5_9MAGN